MVFDVVLTREGGWTLPRFRSCFRRPIRGVLEVFDELDPHLHRATRIARLVDPLTHQPMLVPPPLHDVVLICVRRDYWTLTGIERVPDRLGERVFEYAQSWILTPVADPLHE